jgi:hypothetical protein
VEKPQLVGKTHKVTVEYDRTVEGCSWSPLVSQDTMQAPIKDTEVYITNLLAWFNAEERAIEAKPLNDFGEKNTYKAEQRFFIRFVPNPVVKVQKPKKVVKKVATIKFGKWTVQKDTFEEYASAVSLMRRAYQTPMDDGENMKPLTDPLRQLGTFNKRVELHKKLFKQAGVPYHDSSRATKASWELYSLIEKRIEIRQL